MTDSPDHQQAQQQESIESTTPARDNLGRYKPGHSGNPAGRFAPGVSGNPKGRPPGRGFRETIMRLIEDKNDEGLTQTEQLAATLLGKALGGDLRAIELILKRVWREDYEEPEQPSENLQLSNRILRAHIRMIRSCVESELPIPAEYLRAGYAPPPWAYETEGMDHADTIRHHQKRLGIRGRHGDAWGYESKETAQ